MNGRQHKARPRAREINSKQETTYKMRPFRNDYYAYEYLQAVACAPCSVLVNDDLLAVRSLSFDPAYWQSLGMPLEVRRAPVMDDAREIAKAIISRSMRVPARK